jgi:flagellar biosynthesis GTPase FlhF
MKLVGVISTAVLSLTLGIAAPAYAQQEQHDQQEEQKAKPDQDEKAAQPAKPAKQEEKAAKQEDKNAKPEETNAKQEDKNTQPEEKNAKQEDKRVEPAEKNAQPEQHASGNRGGQIPADKFKSNFGQQHSFRVTQADYSNHRFQYGGYSFGFVDAWPSNWLYTQNVYVIEINGVYYLCNASFPGVNLELSFAL